MYYHYYPTTTTTTTTITTSSGCSIQRIPLYPRRRTCAYTHTIESFFRFRRPRRAVLVAGRQTLSTLGRRRTADTQRTRSPIDSPFVVFYRATISLRPHLHLTGADPSFSTRKVDDAKRAFPGEWASVTTTTKTTTRTRDHTTYGDIHPRRDTDNN